MPALAEPRFPFRWDLITPDHLGTLVDGEAAPKLWFGRALTECAGKVLARCGDGNLYFVGRSLDSMFDLLSGALDDSSWRDRLHRLPLSFDPPGRQVNGEWRLGRISAIHFDQIRQLLQQLGLSPYALARRTRPVTFVDVVSSGSTFTKLYELLWSWIDRDREPWSVIRRKLRFVAVTRRDRSGPHTWRWQRHQPWTSELPARSVLDVSLNGGVWDYLANDQVKLTRSFRPDDWLAEAAGPRREASTAQALAQAVALVAHGRSAQTRKALAQTMRVEPAMAEAWLRTLVGQLSAT